MATLVGQRGYDKQGIGLRNGVRGPGSQGSSWPAGFTPAQRSPAIWLEADLGITLGVGTLVSAWADQSGNGRNVTQGTQASQPTYNSSDAAYNAQATLTFGAAALMQSAVLNLVQPLTWYIVGEATLAPTASYYTFIDGTAARMFVDAHAGDGLLDIFAGAELIAGSGVPNTKSVIGAMFNSASSAGYLNNSQTAVSAGNPGAGGIGTLCVGSDFGSNFLNGKIACIIAVPNADSAAQRLQMFQYLGAKYGKAIS